MTEEQLKKFLETVKTGTSLQKKIKRAVESDATLAIGQEAGLMISADEVKKAQPELSNRDGRHVWWCEQVFSLFLEVIFLWA